MRTRKYVLVCVTVFSILKENRLCDIPDNNHIQSCNRTLEDRGILIDTSTDMPIPPYNDTESHLAYVASFDNHAEIQHPSSYVFIDSLGNHYTSLFNHVFELWDMDLDNLAIISDESGTVIGNSILHRLKDGTAVISLDREIKPYLLPLARHFIVIGNRTLITTVLHMGSTMSLLSSSNTWFILPTDGSKQYSMSEDGLILVLSDNYYSSLNRTVTCLNEAFLTFDCNDTELFLEKVTKDLSTTEITFTVECFRNNSRGMSGTFKNVNDKSLQRPQREPTLRVSLIIVPPYVFKEEKENHVLYSGYLIDILNDISTYCNFTYTMTECSGGVHGIQDSSKWTGCVGDLVNHKVDIALAPLAVTSERDSVVDFVSPYLGTTGLQVLRVRHTPAAFIFLDVFSLSVWLSCLVVLLLTSILLFIFQKYTANEHIHTDSYSSNKTCFGDAVWFVVSSLCFEGCDNSWLNGYSRILVAGLWFFSSIFMACFTANMAAFLTNLRLEDDSSTVLNELKSDATNFTVEAGSWEMEYIKKLAEYEQYFSNIWKNFVTKNIYNVTNYTVWSFPLNMMFTDLQGNINRNPLPSSLDSALTFLNKGYEVIVDSSVASFLTNKNCSLEKVSNPIAIHPVGLAISKGSKYRQIISERLLYLQQTQTFDVLKRKWWQEDSSCTSLEENKGLSMKELQSSFYVLILGVVTAFTVLIMEVLCRRIKRQKYNFSVNKKEDNGNSQTERVSDTSCENRGVDIITEAYNLEEKVDYSNNGIDIGNRNGNSEIEITAYAL
ncbi:GRIN [Mytilus coruscus]|uniref:GRIN n=1 Tax=Mytilus coruscus TaxID=42192 RepID=A0A6J8EXL3_MYTCO|nr:GRIN [Mytilus coruscus]